ncbi:UDP-N-acetylmuramoyl-L-alanyl-D-glutamate--2,6-diaminopimelate ligase [Acinetobacter qingfengensis]|uniref:UDP-N-acetylmuramoyl-L-alanyl-D-glutamate--2,6-diaminopimelate ligase n=1 Tax=Acinetobacter qingfengensis TaxID=1262585 RepID=A0A1E7QYZ3_9GAMM|nr:UDP-N-acetylmuramoyl-L-alanyl-D-glutamate--2,6-diaminopimelate ligase [Acinetobacter qingfengensis]KAA8733145.1 UDP-N-acetylmuramoyl-L-alanyl-D-glutamate--2,6-diaminopimelate ligase [Acinetobacter qingfengensis]OEY92295.1 UDP-N-acetylmuramoyl-L-alanyl-D-glutamate--2,6-diaminopimelate ligase [Acinetobacter qingfengensis]
MTTLAQIWPDQSLVVGWKNTEFKGFCLDSRKVQPGQIFIALQGINNDLEKTQVYMQQALQLGAIGVLTEIEDALNTKDNILYVANLRPILGALQQRFLQAQSPQILARTVAVTGTNGKTTVSRLIAEILTLLQQPTAVMGTTGNGILPNLEASTHTTLDALQFQQMHYQFSQQGAKFLSLEASSHGIDQGRIAGTDIEVAAYTNLSRDHLDYHKTLDNYAKAKARLFDFTSLKHVVINVDDAHAALMIEHAQHNPSQPKIWRYSIENMHAEYVISALNFSLQGAQFRLHTPTGEYSIHSPLLGRFNVENLLAAIISVEKLGFALNAIAPLIPQLHGAPGRMQTITDQNRLFIVDYAHTPDALQQVLQGLRHHVEAELWAVFGCGGDRDRGKRPQMTQAALTTADHIILTSDNPRSENPEQIFADMKTGLDFAGHQVQEIHDRREAIKAAVTQAKAGDIVVIAGKGHENYQEIDGVRHWFDDVIEVQAALNGQHHQPDQAYLA